MKRLFLLLLIMISIATATVLKGPPQSSTIQAAIAESSNSGALLVPVMTYVESYQGASTKQDKGIEDVYDPELRLKELGITLPIPSTPVANYVNGVRTGNLIFLAGKGPKRADGSSIVGKVGVDITIEKGYEAAQLTAINQLAVLKAMLVDLNRVTRVVKVLGMVNSDPSFTDQPKVINGFSDLIVEVFGERGRHARAAVGMASLPGGIAVEIEMIVEVRN